MQLFNGVHRRSVAKVKRHPQKRVLNRNLRALAASIASILLSSSGPFVCSFGC